jgi:hypothetical protein
VTVLAAMCEQSCTIGDGLVALAVAFGVAAAMWVALR